MNRQNQHHKIPEAFQTMIKKDIILSSELINSFKDNMKKTMKMRLINNIVKDFNNKRMKKDNTMKNNNNLKINKLIMKTVKVKDQ